jgi:hypothetical protein
VVKKASKEKITAAYNECFEGKHFATDEQREADRLAQDLEVMIDYQWFNLGFRLSARDCNSFLVWPTCLKTQRKAKLEANKPETVTEKAVEVVDEGPKKYKIVVNKKGDKTTYPKKGDKVLLSTIAKVFCIRILRWPTYWIQVKVNYHGTVDGKIFDSSTDKEWLKTQKRKAEPIVFKVDEQCVSFPFPALCMSSWQFMLQVGNGLVIRGVSPVPALRACVGLRILLDTRMTDAAGCRRLRECFVADGPLDCCGPDSSCWQTLVGISFRSFLTRARS